jgi:hypothetical protein
METRRWIDPQEPIHLQLPALALMMLWMLAERDHPSSQEIVVHHHVGVWPSDCLHKSSRLRREVPQIRYRTQGTRASTSYIAHRSDVPRRTRLRQYKPANRSRCLDLDMTGPACLTTQTWERHRVRSLTQKSALCIFYSTTYSPRTQARGWPFEADFSELYGTFSWCPEVKLSHKLYILSAVYRF